MPALEDYVFAMEALPEEEVLGQALAALWLDVTTTGTCGVATAGEGIGLPRLAVTADGSWRPVGVCLLPLPEIGGATDQWRPAWGASGLPGFIAMGQVSFALRVEAALTPLFALAGTGSLAGTGWPALAVLAGSGGDRQGAAVAPLPLLAARGLCCGLENPVTAGPGSDAVVRLLCQGDPELAGFALALAGGVADADAVAATMLAAVAARLTYTVDGESGGDVWTCALGTYFRGTGDCEDGAVLLHGLLLAAGLPADRLVTAFGRVGTDRTGHAWVGYRRRCDGRWTALDWTRGPAQGPVAGLPVLGEAGYYAVVDYALTAQAFFTVRQDAAVFFARSLAEAVVLPLATVRASGALGARANLALAPNGLSGQGRSGGQARCRLVLPGVSGTAGSARGGGAVPCFVAEALAGASAPAAAPALACAGAGAGGGQAGICLGRPGCVGAAVVAALVAGRLSLVRTRLMATGTAGLIGGAACRLPRPGLRLSGLPGSLALACPVLSMPWCRGVGNTNGTGLAEAGLAALAAECRGRAGGPRLADYAYAPTGAKEGA